MPLLSDTSKEVTTKYGVLNPLFRFANRTTFVVDKSGVIQYSEQTPSPKELPHFEEVKAALAKLK